MTAALYVTSVVAIGAAVVVGSGTMTAASAGAANTRCCDRLARTMGAWLTLAGANASACTDAGDDEPW